MRAKNGIVARDQEPLPNRCPDICAGALRNRKPRSGFSILPSSHELRETARGHRVTGSELSDRQLSLVLVWTKFRPIEVGMRRLCLTNANVDRPRFPCCYGGMHTDPDSSEMLFDSLYRESQPDIREAIRISSALDRSASWTMTSKSENSLRDMSPYTECARTGPLNVAIGMAFFSNKLEQPQKFASKEQVFLYVCFIKKSQFELNFFRNGIPARRLEGLKQHRSNAMLGSEFQKYLPIDALAHEISN